MIDEQLIQSAYERIAADAPAVDRVRDGIQSRVRVRRQRRTVLIGVGAAAAVTATVGPATLLLAARRDRPDGSSSEVSGHGVPTTPVPSVSSTPTLPDRPARLLGYRADWLPSGLVEYHRAVYLAPDAPRGARLWAAPGTADLGKPGTVGVQLSIGERVDDNAGTSVTVNGVTGRLRVPTSKDTIVEWQPRGGPSMVLSVFGLPDNTNTALRIARSIAPDDRTALRSTMYLPWVPDRMQGYEQFGATRTLTGWSQFLGRGTLDYRGSVTIVAALGGPDPLEKTVDTVTLRGQRGNVTATDGAWVRMPDGVLISIQGRKGSYPAEWHTTLEENLRLVEELAYQPPDLSWAAR
ncbi:hypothetical protein OHA72_47590 [Dactylosporangium sp. NBC_01737]|uniref:hypothetical protein n=1 Tax=Dactylosporangium sp. NBC_01737 TaxID=2975959 RepID=UPI002E111697|nr:hypothetical protein OHA72_47590 [Dactylosporangium sp. NBC_01737]